MQDDQPGQPATGFFADVFQSKYREATVSSIIFGILLGVVMNVAITYAGLKIGFTISGSAIAAVLGFGVLRGVMRKGSILEINICQSIASTVNVPCSGVIFTIPVLYLLDVDLSRTRFWLISLACVVGGILGAAFIIPLRKQMIDIERLRFPSAVAVAAILKSPGAGPRKSLVLLAGVLIAMVIYLPVQLPQLSGPGGQPLWGYGDLPALLGAPADDGAEGDAASNVVLTDEEIYLGRLLGLPDYLLLVFAITPLSFGAGYLTGRPGLLVLAGGVLAVFVLNPVAYLMEWMPATVAAHQAADFAHKNLNRPLGIGMILGGACLGVV
ncbi:MAG: OPT/YSL family transporter, partial [Pirellulales bacterium]